MEEPYNQKAVIYYTKDNRVLGDVICNVVVKTSSIVSKDDNNVVPEMLEAVCKEYGIDKECITKIIY